MTEEGEMALSRHSKPPRCPECKRPMEYCDFAVMLAIDLEHEVEPPLWLCRPCWRVVPIRTTTRSRSGVADQAAQG